ncbi:MAG: cckA, partial [Phenylobacterium sp.]|nr:cckA [Phenylobacterium sp.]
MAEPAIRQAETKPGRTVRFDVLTGAAVVFFLSAVGFAAVPALNAGPETLAGLMLLFGLGGVACLGLFVLRGASEPAAETE